MPPPAVLRDRLGRTDTADPLRRRAVTAAWRCPWRITGRGECRRSVMESMMSSAATIFGALTSIRPDLNGDSLCASPMQRRKARATRFTLAYRGESLGVDRQRGARMHVSAKREPAVVVAGSQPRDDTSPQQGVSGREREMCLGLPFRQQSRYLVGVETHIGTSVIPSSASAMRRREQAGRDRRAPPTR